MKWKDIFLIWIIFLLIAILIILAIFYSSSQTNSTKNNPSSNGSDNSCITQNTSWEPDSTLLKNDNFSISFSADGTLYYIRNNSLTHFIIRPLPQQGKTCPFRKLEFDSENGTLLGRIQEDYCWISTSPPPDVPGPYQLILTPNGIFGITTLHYPYTWTWTFPEEFIGKTQCYCQNLSGER